MQRTASVRKRRETGRGDREKGDGDVGEGREGQFNEAQSLCHRCKARKETDMEEIGPSSGWC